MARFVAHFLLHEIDEPGLEVLCQPGMLDVLEKLEPGCHDYLSRPWRADDFEKAAVDYCSLFILPKGAPPFVSAWLGGTPHEHGPRLLAEIGQVSAKLGIEVGYANLPVDHFGIVLTLVAEAWEQDAREAVTALEDGLLRSAIESFSPVARQRTQNVLYRALASLLLQLFNRS